MKHSDKLNIAELNRTLFRSVEYNDQLTYCIGHTSPDSDTVISSIALSHLLNELGIAAEPRISGRLNNETHYLLELVGFPVPELLEDAAGKQVWLVDHSEEAQAVKNIDCATIVGITDHHSLGNVETFKPVSIRVTKTGSCSTLVWKMYVDTDTEITESMARLLLLGIVSDTSFLRRDVFPLDKIAYDYLTDLAHFEDIDAIIEKMMQEKLNYLGYSDKELFCDDLKTYEYEGAKFAIAYVKTPHTNEIEAMANRILSFMQQDIAENAFDFTICLVNDIGYTSQTVVYTGKDIKATQDIIYNAYSKHGEVLSDRVHIVPGLTRKSGIISELHRVLLENG